MLKDIDENNIHIFHQLVQDYEAEFSILTNKKPDSNGRYELDTFPEYPIKGYFWIKDLTPVGFILIDLASKPFNVSEFYVIPSFRRKKVGEEFFCQILNQHKGIWQVKQIQGADQAIIFWRSIISRYTNGQYEEDHFDDPRWGSVTRQTFEAI